MGPPRRRIRRVGSHCGNLGPPNFFEARIADRSSTRGFTSPQRSPCDHRLAPNWQRLGA
jgi:hypothetical protein